MKQTYKKLIAVIIFIFTASVVGVILLFSIRSSPVMTQPFKDINKNEIGKVSMCDNYGNPKADLDEKELDEFIDLVKMIKTGKTTTDTHKDGFSSAKIKIEYKNGDTKILGPNDDIFCIDGVSYEAEKEPSQALEKMRVRILNEKAYKKTK